MNRINLILREVKKVVSGKDDVLAWILAALLAQGHVLLEDMPGVGKTTAALAFAKVLGLTYGRVQFTPDVLPSDITGYSVYRKETGSMQYQPGAVLCNLFLADELNRATSRTQSALLEAMEEGQVTVDGVSHPLPQPFFVLAAQNPTGAAGTQLLPDSQLDRFMLRLSLGYPDPDAEAEMVSRRLAGNPLRLVRPAATAADVIQMQREVQSVYVSDEVIRYIVAMIGATRQNDSILRGASPRATLSVTSLAKSLAYLGGQDYVTPQEAALAFVQATEHRLLMRQDSEKSGTDAAAVLKRIAKTVPAPRI